MRDVIIQLIRRSFVLVVSMFLLGLSTSYAQIGNLSIYGSAPTIEGADIRYVKLTNYPEVEGDNFSYVLPVNDRKNFNFFYTADGNGFLSGGSYRLTYTNASQTIAYGSDVVSYTPNRPIRTARRFGHLILLLRQEGRQHLVFLASLKHMSRMEEVL